MRPIQLFDIGSRGGFSPAWYWLLKNSGSICIHAFDAEPSGRKYSTYPNVEVRVYPFALSDKCLDTSDLFSTKFASQSSFYEPNCQLDVYQDAAYRQRLNYEKIKVNNISTLDREFSSSLPSGIDLIKIDTQGSEYSILRGGHDLLISSMPILAVETWCTDVYKLAPLDFEIMAFLRGLGYELFDSDVAAAWLHKSSIHFPLSKRRLIGNNLLFVPTQERFLTLPQEDLIPKLLVLCFYGFYDYSYLLAENIDSRPARQMIENVYKRDLRLSRLSKLISKIISMTPLSGSALESLFKMPSIT